jgi:hypothetical protein
MIEKHRPSVQGGALLRKDCTIVAAANPDECVGDLLCVESFVRWTVIGRTAEVGQAVLAGMGKGKMEMQTVYSQH